MADRATKVGISDPLDLVDPTPVSPHYEFSADGLATTGFFRIGLGVWNGSSYDRARGDTTSGIWVNEKSDFLNGQTQIIKTVDFTASQTGQTIWDPAAGKKFVITDYDLSFSSAGTITVFDETDDAAGRVIKMYGAVNGGGIHAYKMPRKSSAADNVLKYTTGAGAAGSLTIIGYEI